MAEPKVFIVVSRRPGKDDPRNDPFYEFGSFGCTRCHSTNLMRIANADNLSDGRLAFVQGGPDGFRLVLLTPPIEVQAIGNSCVARWRRVMPFKYSDAPVVVCNGGRGHFPGIKRYVNHTNRSTIEGKFSSRFRSRVEQLEPDLAKELIHVYQEQRRLAPRSAIASEYHQALPGLTRVDDHRKRTYQRLLRKRFAEAGGTRSLCETMPRRAVRPRKGGCA
jgi:hypothetical protein